MSTQRWWGGVSGAVVLAGALTGGAWAQESVAMAPPVGNRADATAGGETVFYWNEIPQGQQVALTRASFDKAGYQLYDTVGETIIVPFENDNLYVMKFGRSAGGTMYFVNEGGQPTLYVPDNGYLENATTAGGRWYPFSKDFQPQQPVYLGLAPSYTDYVSMGWYPGMTYWGGFYSASPYFGSAAFVPSPGLYFQIGNQPYYGWGAYQNYYLAHPHYSPIAVYRPYYYRPRGTVRPFVYGGSTYYAHRPFGGVRPFNGPRLLNGILPSPRITGSPRGSAGSRVNIVNRVNQNVIINRPSPAAPRNFGGGVIRDPRVFNGGQPSLPSRPSFNSRPGGMNFPGASPFRGNSNGNFNRPQFRGSAPGNFSRPSGNFRPSPGGGGRRG